MSGLTHHGSKVSINSIEKSLQRDHHASSLHRKYRAVEWLAQDATADFGAVCGAEDDSAAILVSEIDACDMGSVNIDMAEQNQRIVLVYLLRR
jgi:hypothetical protein